MNIAVITSIYNEIDLLPQFLHHYRTQGVSHFFILDNHSDDGSFEYAGFQSDCTVIRYGHPDELDDSLKVEEVVRCKAAISQQYDYVVMPDCDEFLVSACDMTLREHIKTYPKSIYGSVGYNMIEHRDDLAYDPELPLTKQRKYGFPFAPYSKPIACISDFEGEWGAGMHDVRVDGAVISPPPDFILLHYVAFDETIAVRRRERQGRRVGIINIQRGHGIGNVGKSREYWIEWFRGHCNHAEIRKVIP